MYKMYRLFLATPGLRCLCDKTRKGTGRQGLDGESKKWFEPYM